MVKVKEMENIDKVITLDLVVNRSELNNGEGYYYVDKVITKEVCDLIRKDFKLRLRLDKESLDSFKSDQEYVEINKLSNIDLKYFNDLVHHSLIINVRVINDETKDFKEELKKGLEVEIIDGSLDEVSKDLEVSQTDEEVNKEDEVNKKDEVSKDLEVNKEDEVNKDEVSKDLEVNKEDEVNQDEVNKEDEVYEENQNKLEVDEKLENQQKREVNEESESEDKKETKEEEVMLEVMDEDKEIDFSKIREEDKAMDKNIEKVIVKKEISEILDDLSKFGNKDKIIVFNNGFKYAIGNELEVLKNFGKGNMFITSPKFDSNNILYVFVNRFFYLINELAGFEDSKNKIFIRCKINNLVIPFESERVNLINHDGLKGFYVDDFTYKNLTIVFLVVNNSGKGEEDVIDKELSNLKHEQEKKNPSFSSKMNGKKQSSCEEDNIICFCY
ncbi:hypothetical protein A0H76_2097 [Hepatospora eriocheir]|uniref:Uncharacterized protein n=1 Tax=Hepatospora eriocheir TaxID=1081669 RepID=A0A1X0QK79_9MICR|nr:hypothetical protein A0H76_2097 [Hepatospora eriocheir]